MPLIEYKHKRKFKQTPEPEGKIFKSTSEKGTRKQNVSQQSFHFVVQEHHASHLHFDFRLEMEGVLKSWAVPKGPSMNPLVKRLAVMVEDHPLEYGKFEGVIPKGNYGAGQVYIWDKGTYFPVGELDPKNRDDMEKILLKQLKKGHITFVLKGEKLKGTFDLVRTKNYGRTPNDKNWLLIKKEDQYSTSSSAAEPLNNLLQEDNRRNATGPKSSATGSNSNATGPKSSATGRNKNQISEMFSRPIKPMFATLAKDVFDDPNWFYELKWDGYRAIAKVDHQNVALMSRNQQSFNKDFMPIVVSLQQLNNSMILDGEIVVVDEEGKSDFQLLQNYRKTGKGNLVYYIFDILEVRGEDLRDLPLLERKKILKEQLEKKNISHEKISHEHATHEDITHQQTSHKTDGYLKISEYVTQKGKEFFELVKQRGLEGIMAKNGASKYYEGARTKEWLKIKNHHRQEAVIGGITEPRGGRQGFGALVLGVYENKKLLYIGHTGTGFNEKDLLYYKKKFEPYFSNKCPFAFEPKVNAPVTWMKPELVCEIRFAEWTEDGVMRQPVFLGLREDKKASEVQKELPQKVLPQKELPRKVLSRKESPQKIPLPKEEKGNRMYSVASSPSAPKAQLQSRRQKTSTNALKLANQDKTFWPKEKITKGNLINYYQEVWPFIKPFLKNRPQTLHRFPEGINQESFYQKDMKDPLPDWLETVEIYSETDNKNIRYAMANNKESLLYLANLGCIEINVWNAHVPDKDYPDYAVIDLDPVEIGFDKVVETALITKRVLDQAKIESYCKTSGATGLHIFIPLGAKYSTSQVLTFTEIIARLVHRKIPEITSLERSPQKRKKKVYLDYLQNRKYQTMVAPYSVRPRSGAPVSTPLRWEEVRKGLDPQKFTLKNILKRLEKNGELWKGVLGKGINLEKVLTLLEKSL